MPWEAHSHPAHHSSREAQTLPSAGGGGGKALPVSLGTAGKGPASGGSRSPRTLKGLSCRGPSPRETCRRCSRGTDCPSCSGGVSGERDTPRLGPHGSILTPAPSLLDAPPPPPSHPHCCGWRALRRAMPGGLGEPGWQTKELLTPVPTPSAAGAWRPPLLQGGGAEEEGREASATLARSQRSQLTQAGEGEPLGTAQARSPAGKARPRPGLALAALQRSPPAPRRATGLQGVSSKRSSQGTYYRQRRRRVKNSPGPAAGERRRAADGPYLPPGEPWEGDAPWPGHRIPPLTEPAPRSGPLRTPAAEGAAQRQGRSPAPPPADGRAGGRRRGGAESQRTGRDILGVGWGL